MTYPRSDERGSITRVAGQDRCVTFPRPTTDNCLDVTAVSFGTGFALFSASPSLIDVNTPPATCTISGSGISAANGMPVIEYYDENEVFIQRTTAYEVAADGTWLKVHVPNMSSVYTGRYNIEISNVMADGTRQIAGSAPLEAYGRPADADGDGYKCYGAYGNDCDDSDAMIHPGTPTCYNMLIDGNCDGIIDFDQPPCNGW